MSDYRPQGDQPKAIAALSEGVERGDRMQTLVGVTGSGKTFTMTSDFETPQRRARREQFAKAAYTS